MVRIGLESSRSRKAAIIAGERRRPRRERGRPGWRDGGAQRSLLRRAAQEHAVARAEVLDGVHAGGRSAAHVDGGRQMTHQRQPLALGLGHGGEERVRSGVGQLDEVGALQLLAIDLSHRGFRRRRADPRQDRPGMAKQSRGVGGREQLPLAPPLQELRRARHLPPAGDPVGQHQLQAARLIVGSQRMGVHVEEAGAQELAPGCCQSNGNLSPLGRNVPYPGLRQAATARHSASAAERRSL